MRWIHYGLAAVAFRLASGDRKNDHMWSPDASDLRSPMTARELLF